LSEYIGKSIHIRCEDEYKMYNIKELELVNTTLVDEQQFLKNTPTEYYSHSGELKVLKGEKRYIELSINNETDLGQYLKIEAVGLKATVVYNNQVINRLYFNENDKVRMTGGGKDRVYLPRHWNKGTNSKVYLYVEGLDDLAILRNIKVFQVNM
jgi:hypothetical protein